MNRFLGGLPCAPARRAGGRLALALVVLVSTAAGAPAGYTTMWNNGPSSNRVDMVFLGDGYTSSQIGTTYVSHINAMLDHMFFDGEDPFPRYQNFFNVHRIDVVSNESGADVAPLGIFRDTALGARYYGDGVTERSLRINPLAALTAETQNLAGAGFSAEMRLVTVNDTRYGGTGGAYAVYAGGNSAAPEIALHEIGHAFANLADEYEYDGPTVYTGPEPERPNITTNSSGAKWSQWLGYNQPGIGVIGAYEGAGTSEQGLYRPSVNSKMRSLNRPFDAVSREALILEIYELVDPLDAWLAADGLLVNAPLWVDVVDPNVIDVEWYVDGILVPGASGETFSLADWGFGTGTYEVMARAFDDTDWVRVHRELLEQQVSWTVELVPEPSSVVLGLLGMIGLCLAARRRKRIAAVR